MTSSPRAARCRARAGAPARARHVLDGARSSGARRTGAARARIVEAFRRDARLACGGSRPPRRGPRVGRHADAGTARRARAPARAGGRRARGRPRTRRSRCRARGPEGAAWQAFARAALGFVPVTATAPVVRAWRGSFAPLRPNPGVYSAAYGPTADDALTTSTTRDPDVIPPDGAPLQDWFAFASVVLPMRRRAHRFTVLLPAAGAGDSAAYELRRRALASASSSCRSRRTRSSTSASSGRRSGSARPASATTLADLAEQPALLADAAGPAHLGGPSSAAPRAPSPETDRRSAARPCLRTTSAAEETP